MPENIYGVAYVKSLEKNMFSKSDFEDMLSISPENLHASLSERGYDGKDIKEMLQNEEEKTAKICRELCENNDLSRIMLAKNDFHNIKTALKLGIMGGGKKLFKMPTNLVPQEIETAARKGDFRSLEEEFSDIVKDAYAEYKKEKTLQAIDLYVDARMREYILKKSKSDEFVRGWAELYDKMWQRKEEALSDSEKKYLPLFFRECDDDLTEYLKKAHFSFFEDGAIFAYFFGKQTEFKNLRLILCRINGIGEDVIRERLRETYV